MTAPSATSDPPGTAGTRSHHSPSSGHNQQARQVRRTLTVLVLPSVLLLLLINFYPLFYALVQSLRNGTLIVAGDFVGLGNYGDVLADPAFWRAVRFTVLFTVVSVFSSWAIGLALALLLRSDLPGRGGFKVLLLLPWVVPIVVSAKAWNWLTATPQSPLPALAGLLGLNAPLFLADPMLVKIVVCAFEIWVNFPFMMMMNSAALASVDDSVYEAARMDGASGRQQLFHITLPLVARSTYISWILMTIFVVNDFPTIYLLTGGGPIDATTTLVILAYRSVFENFQVGFGVAIAFLMSLTLVFVSVVLYRQVRKADA